MIGVFDSGVGGLGVLARVHSLLPEADVLYAADPMRAPFGTRSLEEVAGIAMDISDWLLNQGAETVVVACNTASAAALHRLRALHPGTSFVGMEPAVKPAALETTTGVIAVLATAATFQGDLFSSVVRRHASSVEVVTAACPEWVEIVESGELDGPDVEQIVAARVRPLLDRRADRLVLGCTHFPFLMKHIQGLVGDAAAVIDPAAAVARQVARMTGGSGGTGRLLLASSGDTHALERSLHSLTGLRAAGPALPLPRWR